MTLNVTPSGNRQSWDARVRVTGGHPDLLWGIGEAEALTRDDVRVQRVAVDRGNQTVGYGQLLVYPEDRHTVVDAKSLHVKNPRDLVAVLAALQEHSRTVHDAAVLRVSPDTHATTELADELAEAGYRRRDKPRRGEAGPATWWCASGRPRVSCPSGCRARPCSAAARGCGTPGCGSGA